MKRNPFFVCLALNLGLALAGAAPQVPGVVIDHSPAASGLYIGSPSLAILTNGHYVASHDFFGPKSAEFKAARTAVFRSVDRGQTWQPQAVIEGAFWSTLFVHRGALHLLGTDRHHGNVVIRRSVDEGATWTQPTNAATGLLRDTGEHHCAPMPVIEHNGRLWRAMEWRNPPVAWGINYRAGMLSVPVDADLLRAANWTFSEFLPSQRTWNGGDMGAWLEGNAVVTPAGQMVDMLRVQTRSPAEKAAIVGVGPDGKTTTFDPLTGFVDFPGGGKKFTIRHDAQSGQYWSLATVVPERHRAENPGGIRNTLALTCSPDLTNWTVRTLLLHHPDTARHGFQYVDWLFEGDDLIAACRTAHDDEQGGAHNYHDANYLTFHRWANFRKLTLADSVPLPAQAPATVVKTAQLEITGRGWTLTPLANGAKAFSNRNYVWQEVPKAFQGWRHTQTGGGVRAELTVKALADTTVYLAATQPKAETAPAGWTPVPEGTFQYTDGARTRMVIYQRALKAGETVGIAQGNWTGSLLLVPPEK
jgi:hypothetical protein